MKRTRFFVMALAAMLSVGLCSCEKENNGNGSVNIIGTWIDGSKTMELERDGKYMLTDISIPEHPQYRKGTYSYNENQSLLCVDVVAVAGRNGAYQQTYIVQTLTATTLVLLYTDGDVEGYYTRK